MPAPKGNKNAIGNKGGRPTDFDPKYTKELVSFFDIEAYKKEVMESNKEYFADGRLKKQFDKFKFVPNKMPTLYRFARKIDVAYSTVWRWAEKGETLQKLNDKSEEMVWKEELDKDFVEFCNAYKEAKELQKDFLISLGLAGATPPASFIFVAKNVTDMKDKVETDLTSGGKPLSPTIDVKNPKVMAAYNKLQEALENGDEVAEEDD
jgi:hypothetical protein